MGVPHWIVDINKRFIHEDLNRDLFLEWVKEFNIDGLYSGLPLWPKMLPRKFQQIKELSDSEQIPFALDCEMYEHFNRSKVLVVHFNGEQLDEYKEKLIEFFLFERGLEVNWLSFDESWYNPGVSVTAIITISDIDKYIDYINMNRKYDGKLNKHWL